MSVYLSPSLAYRPSIYKYNPLVTIVTNHLSSYSLVCWKQLQRQDLPFHLVEQWCPMMMVPLPGDAETNMDKEMKLLSFSTQKVNAIVY